jgi:hypothetical protein
MSDGLNKAFRQAMVGGTADPVKFLSTHVFESQPHQSLASKTGVLEVNLVEVGRFVSVQLAGKTSAMSNAFSAYICPNILKSSPVVQLGSEADFFFTPALTGCALEINGNSVTHHDGLLTPFPPTSLKGVRRGGGGGRRQWTNGDFYASVVIGVRGSAGWTFYQQSYNPNQNAPLPVSQVSVV